MSDQKCWNCGDAMVLDIINGQPTYRCPSCKATAVPHAGDMIEKASPIKRDLPAPAAAGKKGKK
jgi:tRNA(Ile2) C34 agmatinyltransferase TiaS